VVLDRPAEPVVATAESIDDDTDVSAAAEDVASCRLFRLLRPLARPGRGTTIDCKSQA